ncbi:hypothetical protein FQA39_LY04224 [Lamprigera yunnana]|nr:hypothetical protein FQA39_LY04224 [Lamprigera yunnana]
MVNQHRFSNRNLGIDANIFPYRYFTTVQVSELKPVQIEEVEWCFSFTFRCSKMVTRLKTFYKTARLSKVRLVKSCCDGYKLDTEKKHCLPVCSESCVHGKCLAPNTCKCDYGYDGPSCNFSCPKGLWGKECEYDCVCENNSTCNVFNGKCNCQAGWKGALCDKRCDNGTYGTDCKEKCNCNHGECNHISGSCSCYPGFSGKFCENSLNTQVLSLDKCTCVNGGTCNLNNNKCICNSGWTGEKCEKTCDFGFWGSNCSSICSCSKGGKCHHATGKCFCLPGFKGPDCLTQRAEGTYGTRCLFTCNCHNQGRCSHVNGMCTCFNGWSGKHCEISTCKNSTCNCSNDVPDLDCSDTCSDYCNSSKTHAYLGCHCPNENYICDTKKGCICKNGSEGDDCGKKELNTLLLYGGGVFVIILLLLCAVGIFIICILLIKYQKSKKFVESSNVTNNLMEEDKIDILTILAKNNYIKDRLLNNYPNCNNLKAMHHYEEIGSLDEQYDSLDHNRPTNSRNLTYDNCLRQLR